MPKSSDSGFRIAQIVLFEPYLFLSGYSMNNFVLYRQVVRQNSKLPTQVVIFVISEVEIVQIDQCLLLHRFFSWLFTADFSGFLIFTKLHFSNENFENLNKREREKGGLYLTKNSVKPGSFIPIKE